MSQATKTYEAMFLLGTAGTDFETACEPVRTVLGRYQAEVLLLKAWDERKLAYEIAGHKRGLYALSFFSVDPARVAEIEHDCQLDERILRVLILRRDRLTAEQVEAERTSTAKPPAGRDSESRGGEGDRRRGRYHRDSGRDEEGSADREVSSSGETNESAEDSGSEDDTKDRDKAATD